jgi:hypothetical protein
MFNKAKGEETRTNKMYYKQRFGLRFRVKYEMCCCCYGWFKKN